jgi:hypothetical protein
LLTFDADAFRTDGDVSQELCNLMLAFALAFNDCRDVLMWHQELMDQAPAAPQRLNRWFGEHGGSITHTFRLLIGLAHEVGELVQRNAKTLHEPFFNEKVLSKLDKDQRARWERLRDLAFAKPSEKSMDGLLEFLRNKMTYHYDAADLWPAYDRRFPSGPSDKLKQPLVSLSSDIRGHRFYFADAVAYDLVEEEGRQRGLAPLGPKMSTVLTDLMVSLERIVEAFLQARRPWRNFEEES